METELTPNQITNHLFSDMYSYEPFIKAMVAEHLSTNENSRVYWEAWFRGAEGVDLEKAEKGIKFKKP